MTPSLPHSSGHLELGMGEFDCVDILRVAACRSCEIVGTDW